MIVREITCREPWMIDLRHCVRDRLFHAVFVLSSLRHLSSVEGATDDFGSLSNTAVQALAAAGRLQIEITEVNLVCRSLIALRGEPKCWNAA